MRGDKDARGYVDVYESFHSPVMRQVREEAYGEDIGQHSWVTVEELAEDISRLKLSPASRLLDLGCGPWGPLTFIVSRTGCHATGADSSAEAIAAGKLRAASLQLDARVSLLQADLNEPLPFPNSSFEAVISIDVVLHLRDRSQMFQQASRVLTSSGRFLFTDAAVITGEVSEEETQRRASYGPVQFAPPGFNKDMLELAGLQLMEQQDRTASLLKNAAGRLAARQSHRTELEKRKPQPVSSTSKPISKRSWPGREEEPCPELCTWRSCPPNSAAIDSPYAGTTVRLTNPHKQEYFRRYISERRGSMPSSDIRPSEVAVT